MTQHIRWGFLSFLYTQETRQARENILLSVGLHRGNTPKSINEPNLGQLLRYTVDARGDIDSGGTLGY